ISSHDQSLDRCIIYHLSLILSLVSKINPLPTVTFIVLLHRFDICVRLSSPTSTHSFDHRTVTFTLSHSLDHSQSVSISSYLIRSLCSSLSLSVSSMFSYAFHSITHHPSL